jgi:hypothetical protein
MTDDQLTRDDPPDIPPDAWIFWPTAGWDLDRPDPEYEDDPEDLAEAA